MARSFGRVFASIWADDDFRAVPVDARLMYVFLLSQPDLDHAGVIPLRIRRWSRSLGLSTGEVEKMLSDLDGGRFAVIDWDTEELLVRSLIRRDEVWRQPNVFKSAATSAAGCESARIKSAILDELRRLDLSSASREIQHTRDELLTLLEPFGNPPPTPPGASRTPPAEPTSAVPVDSESDRTDETGISAGRKGSGRVSEPQAGGTSELQGKGNGYGPVLQEAFPLKTSPSPRGAAQAIRPPLLVVVPDAKPEEGEDSLPGENPDLPALTAEVRRIRSAWSTRSIRRALADESVTERPWPLVRAAMLAVARDPESKHPGRLLGDGPWWETPAPRSAPRRPPWCGSCDERTRLLEDDQGRPYRCPECHPKAEAS